MIKKLQWDSDFLGKEVAALAAETDRVAFESSYEQFDLIYLFTDEPAVISREFLERYSVTLTDEKLTYHKLISQVSEIDTGIRLLDKDHFVDERLRSIALQSGIYSRFNVDTLFPHEKFLELYKLWITNSVNRLIAEAVFVYEVDGEVAGLITMSLKNEVPDIGLIAVDELYRGRRIGYKLIAAAEFWAMKQKHKNELQVITQSANETACLFYEKTGFTLKRKQYVYHCWKK